MALFLALLIERAAGQNPAVSNCGDNAEGRRAVQPRELASFGGLRSRLPRGTKTAATGVAETEPNLANKISWSVHGNALSMSQSYRLHQLAIGMCLIVTFAPQLASESRAQGDTAASASASQQQNEPAPPSVIQPQMTELDYRISCVRPEDHDAADLCEQRRMAQAAEEAVFWARWQTLISVLGFSAVFVSLILSAVATRAASRAAKAAENAIVVENRAWISFRQWNFGIDNDGTSAHPHFRFLWINKGKTPALNIQAWTGRAEAECFKGGLEIAFDESTTNMPIGPDGEFRSAPIFFTPQEIMASSQIPIRIRHSVRYKTAFPDLGERFSDLTLEVIYRGTAGIGEIAVGHIGPENFAVRPIGEFNRMT